MVLSAVSWFAIAGRDSKGSFADLVVLLIAGGVIAHNAGVDPDGRGGWPPCRARLWRLDCCLPLSDGYVGLWPDGGVELHLLDRKGRAGGAGPGAGGRAGPHRTRQHRVPARLERGAPHQPGPPRPTGPDLARPPACRPARPDVEVCSLPVN